MNKRVVRRLLETFFRRWWLFLLPFVLFTAVGVAKAMTTSTGYQSVGVVDVSSETLLSQLTSVRGDVFGYETPATSTARTINSLLGTDQFVEAVAEDAGLTGALSRGEVSLFGLRSSIGAAPQGDSLLRVAATTANPELSARLVQSTIESFIQYVVDGEVSESRAAEAFFEDQIELYSAEVDRAQAALREYVVANPGGPLDDRPLDEQIEINRLTSAVDVAAARLATAQQKSEEARLATEQSTDDVRQRLRIVDSPEVPSAPQPFLRDAVTTVAVFMIVGILLTCAGVVLATVADRSVRTADDVEQLLELPLLASVPEVRRTRSRRSRRSARDRTPAPTSPPDAKMPAPGGRPDEPPGRSGANVSPVPGATQPATAPPVARSASR